MMPDSLRARGVPVSPFDPSHVGTSPRIPTGGDEIVFELDALSCCAHTERCCAGLVHAQGKKERPASR